MRTTGWSYLPYNRDLGHPHLGRLEFSKHCTPSSSSADKRQVQPAATTLYLPEQVKGDLALATEVGRLEQVPVPDKIDRGGAAQRPIDLELLLRQQARHLRPEST